MVEINKRSEEDVIGGIKNIDSAMPRKNHVLTKEEIHKMYKKSIDEFQNALDLDVPQGIFEYIKAPSVVVVGILVAYLIGRFRLSIFLLVALIYTVVFKFKRRMQKFKVSLQNLVYSQTRKEKVAGKWETVEWINYVVTRFWTVVEPVISEEVFRKVNTFLYENCPSFLSSISLKEFTLGSLPPKVTGIMFYENVGEDIVQIDGEVFFIPLETSKEAHFFFKKASSGVAYNSKVTLVVRVGAKTNFGTTLPLYILVKNISFKAKTRVILTMTKKNFFIKEVEICLLEEPYIDFTLKPMKTLDVMELPGLSDWINGTILMVLRQNLVNPQSLKINLEKLVEEKTEVVGVLCLQLLEFESRDSEQLHGEIDIDGKRLYMTNTREGAAFSFNEFFYLIISNIDDFVNFNLVSGNKISRGSLQIKKILDGSTLETMKIQDAEKVRATQKFVAHYYPLMCAEGKKRLTNAALVTMSIIQIDELQALNTSRKKYTTSCSIIVSPDKLEPIKKGSSSLLLKSTVYATANLLGGIFDTITGFSKKEKLLPSSRNTFFIHQTKTIVDSKSPKFEDKCVFLSRNVSMDIIKICVMDKEGESSKILGSVEIPVSNVYSNTKEWYRLKDVNKGRIEIHFKMDYVQLKDERAAFKDYKKILNINFKEVMTIFGNGNYTAVFKSKCGFFKVETFCIGSTKLKRTVLVPIEDKDNLRLYLYKENPREENFIGIGTVLDEGRYVTGETPVNEIVESSIEEARTEDVESQIITRDVVIKNDDAEAGSILLNIEEELLREYKGVSSDKDEAKVIQVRFSNFQGVHDDFRIEFRNPEELLACSKISFNKQVGETFTLITGYEDIKARVVSIKLGKDVLIGECIIPKRRMNENVLINDTGSSCNIEVKVLCCSFRFFSSLKRGTLRLTINSIQDLKGSDSTGLRDTYCKVYINNIQIHRTKIKKKSLNPVFNEEITIYLDKRYDEIKITVQDWSQFEASPVIGVVETSLYFLEEGKCVQKLQLLDPHTFMPTKAYVDTAFEFSRDEQPSKKKKNILSSIFPF